MSENYGKCLSQLLRARGDFRVFKLLVLAKPTNQPSINFFDFFMAFFDILYNFFMTF